MRQESMITKVATFVCICLDIIIARCKNVLRDECDYNTHSLVRQSSLPLGNWHIMSAIKNNPLLFPQRAGRLYLFFSCTIITFTEVNQDEVHFLIFYSFSIYPDCPHKLLQPISENKHLFKNTYLLSLHLWRWPLLYGLYVPFLYIFWKLNRPHIHTYVFIQRIT